MAGGSSDLLGGTTTSRGNQARARGEQKYPKTRVKKIRVCTTLVHHTYKTHPHLGPLPEHYKITTYAMQQPAFAHTRYFPFEEHSLDLSTLQNTSLTMHTTRVSYIQNITNPNYRVRTVDKHDFVTHTCDSFPQTQTTRRLLEKNIWLLY